MINSLGGNVGGQASQDAIYERLGQLGVKVASSKTGVSNPGGLRTYLAQLECLGFLLRDAGGWAPTIAGQQMIDATNPLDVLRCQLLRMQFPSVYGDGRNVQVSHSVRIKPFAFLLRLLRDSRIQTMDSIEAAIPVICGRTDSDFGKCVTKILKGRSYRQNKFSVCRTRVNAIEALKSVIDDVDDLTTIRRFVSSETSELQVKQLGCVDAKEIGNTALNFLCAAQLITELSRGVWALNEEASAVKAMTLYLREKHKLESAPVKGCEIAWQRRFGRYDRTRVTPSQSVRRKVSGRDALVSSDYITAIQKNPFGFNEHDLFNEMSRKYGNSLQEVVDACKAVHNLFLRLGFDYSLNVSHRVAPGRDGGYPYTYVRTSTMQTCGFADLRMQRRRFAMILHSQINSNCRHTIKTVN